MTTRLLLFLFLFLTVGPVVSGLTKETIESMRVELANYKTLPLSTLFLLSLNVLNNHIIVKELCEYVCIREKEYSYSNYSVPYNHCYITINNYTDDVLWRYRVFWYQVQLGAMRILNDLQPPLSNITKMLIGEQQRYRTVTCFNLISTDDATRMKLSKLLSKPADFEKSAIYGLEMARVTSTLDGAADFCIQRINEANQIKQNSEIYLEMAKMKTTLEDVCDQRIAEANNIWKYGWALFIVMGVILLIIALFCPVHPDLSITDVSGTMIPVVQKLLDSTIDSKELGRGKDIQIKFPTSPERPPYSSLKVLKVEKIENRNLWQKYCQRLKDLEQKRNVDRRIASKTEHLEGFPKLKSGLNEVFLFHTPKQDWNVIHGIALEGFNQRFSQMTEYNGKREAGGLFGVGMYFAEDITKADQYAPPKMDTYTFLIARVCLGNPHFIEEHFRSEFQAPEGTDSVVGRVDLSKPDYPSVGRFREFSVYYESQAYPEYLVKVQRRS